MVAEWDGLGQCPCLSSSMYYYANDRLVNLFSAARVECCIKITLFEITSDIHTVKTEDLAANNIWCYLSVQLFTVVRRSVF